MPREFDINKTYDRVGYCIYCGSHDSLTDEHPIPFGLGGKAVLPKASCKKCARITGQVEAKILRGPLQQMRVARDVQSRTKHKDAPTTRTYEITRAADIHEFVVQGFIEPPVQCIWPTFDLPGLLKPQGNAQGITLTGYALRYFGPSMLDVSASLNALEMTWREKFMPFEFARMIAKIAYSCVFAYAWDDGHEPPFQEPSFVIPAILGNDPNVGQWIGTNETPSRTKCDRLHDVNFIKTPDDQFIVAEVQLFVEPQSPCYVVVLGRVRNPNSTNGSRLPS